MSLETKVRDALIRADRGVSFEPDVESFLAMLSAEDSSTASRSLPAGRRSFRWRVAVAGIAAAALLTGTAAASQKALPNDPLFRVRRVTESVWVQVPGSDLAAAWRHIQIAYRYLGDAISSGKNRDELARLVFAETSRARELAATAPSENRSQVEAEAARIDSHMKNLLDGRSSRSGSGSEREDDEPDETEDSSGPSGSDSSGSGSGDSEDDTDSSGPGSGSDSDDDSSGSSNSGSSSTDEENELNGGSGSSGSSGSLDVDNSGPGSSGSGSDD